MKYLIQSILVCVFLLPGKSYINAQDEGIPSQYILNPVFVNVGATGFYDQHRLRFNFRNQWSGFEGAPSNYTLSYNGRVSDNDGIGIILGTQSYNAINRYRARLSYGYNFRINNVDIGLGLGLEYQQMVLKSNALTNGLIEENDPLINELAEGAQYIGADFGIYGSYKDKFIFGVGIPDLFRSRLGNTVVQDSLTESTTFKYYSFYAGYKFHLIDYGIVIYPSAMYRKSFRYTDEADLNVRVTFLEGNLITGVTYTIGGTQGLAVLLGGRIHNFLITYGYDISHREFQHYNGGTHELTIGLNFGSDGESVMKKTHESEPGE